MVSNGVELETLARVAKNCCKIICSDMGFITGVLLTAVANSIIFLSKNYDKLWLLFQGISYYGVVTITEITVFILYTR